MALLVQIVRKRAFLSFATVCTSVLFATVTLWWNAQLSDIIDTISGGGSLATETIVLAIIAMVAMCLSSLMKTYLSGYACEILTHDLRIGYARYFSLLPISEIERLNAGEQLSKLQNEIADVSGYLNNNLFQLINDGISFITTLGWLLILNTKLTLAVNLPVLVIMIYVFYSSKIISNATEHSQQAKGRMNKYADTLLTLFPIIRLYDATQMILRNYNNEVTEWERQTIRIERLRARLMSLSGFLSNIPLMLLFLVGGGKSTLLKLISGLYDVPDGRIIIGESQTSPERRKHVAMVMQNAMLFPASIRDNISCGHDMDKTVLYHACDMAQLTEWISVLPDGLDTFVGERGGQISGGQAQRIAIARAMPRLNKKSLEATAKNTGELTALITCTDVALLYGGQDYLIKRFEQRSLELLRARMEIHKRNALGAAILPLFGLGGYLVLLMANSTWISNRLLTFGDLTAAFQYRNGVLIGSMMLINCIVSIQASMAGLHRINEIMAEKTEE